MRVTHNARNRQTVWNSRDDDWPQYDAHYKYDNRDQLLEERYFVSVPGTGAKCNLKANKYLILSLSKELLRKLCDEDIVQSVGYQYCLVWLSRSVKNRAKPSPRANHVKNVKISSLATHYL